VKETGGGGKLKYDILIYCKKFCKCHNVPPPRTTIKKIKITIRTQSLVVVVHSGNQRGEEDEAGGS
jgi:hypothetical protein